MNPEPTEHTGQSGQSGQSGPFVVLSRAYAQQGDVRMAVLAAWMADVQVLEGLLWENGLGQAPDPLAQLAAVGESVSASMEDGTAALATGGPVTARAVVEAARQALVTTFDESVHDLLTDRFADLDHLDRCVPGPQAADPGDRPVSRLGGRTPAELGTALRTTAADAMTVARALLADGDEATARSLVLQSDVAAYEGYLLAAAAAGGDRYLASVDLRWDLVVAGVVGTDVAASGDPVARRERMAASVGFAEREALLAGLEPLALS